MISAIGATASAATDSSSTPQPRLVRAAHEFEAQMMKEMMKPLTNSFSASGADEDSDSSSGSAGALGEYASESLARALSEAGGFGIANRIVHDLSSSGNRPVTGQVTGNQHDDTVMKISQ